MTCPIKTPGVLNSGTFVEGLFHQEPVYLPSYSVSLLEMCSVITSYMTLKVLKPR